MDFVFKTHGMVLDYREILDAIRDAVIVSDADERVLFANGSAAMLLGYDVGELAGRPLGDIVPAAVRSQGQPRAGRVPTSRTAEPDANFTRARVLSASGREIAVELAVDNATSDGRSLEVWTLRPEGSREGLLENRLALSAALTAMAEAFVQMSAHPDAERVTQIMAETLAGRLGGAAARVWLCDTGQRCDLKAAAGLDPSIDRAAAVTADPAGYGLGLADVVRTQQPHFVADVRLGDVAMPAWFERAGLVAFALIPLVFDDHLSGIAAYYTREPISQEIFQVITAFARHAAVALHDVNEQATARRQIEALAREAHARTGEFEAIVSNMPDAVIVVREGRVSFVNRTAARMLGFSNAADLLVPIDEFARLTGLRDGGTGPVPGKDQTLEQVLQGEVITGRERRMTHSATGREIWVQIAGAPLRDRNGDIQGGVVVATEITRLKELEHSKDEWLAIAAHELRTPLTPITVHLQMAQRRLHMGRPIGPEVFDRALEQVKRLARLVNGLLDVTRLQAGQLDLLLEDIDAREVAEAIVERVRHGALRHTLVLDLDPTPVLVHADRSRIDEVISALVDNAIKYSPDGGEVWVSVRGTGDVAMIAVRDEGIGIGHEERDEIFERYFRAGSVPLSQYSGLGLGLWIAGKVVQKHGGHIELESALGKGSTFRVVLPLAATQELGETEMEEPHRARVLVVDDDLPVLEAAKELLDEDGYDVRLARSGNEALEIVNVWLPEVILLDLRMPGMDGWEVRQALSSNPATASVPVILVSADRDARNRSAGMDVQGFVAKPFDLEELERALRDVLSESENTGGRHAAGA